MREHCVELASEPERPHVALDVLALGIQRAAELEHLLRDVGQRELEAALQMRGVVPAAGAELEHRRNVTVGHGLEHARDEVRLLDVVVRMRQEVEPGREVGVEAHATGQAKAPTASELTTGSTG